VSRGWWIGGALALGSVLLDLATGHPAHGASWWHRTPGFDLVYGLLGCAVIVVASKALGKAWLQRDERYYEDEGP
jgi:hypothetical protein